MACSVATGWGSVSNVAEVEIGDAIAVVGVGGVGANAVQAAHRLGAAHVFAIDPVEFKRTTAERLGATRTFSSLADAREEIQGLTAGVGCAAVVMTIGVGDGSLVSEAMPLVAKRGRLVVVNLHPARETTVALQLLDLTLMGQQIVGSVVGACNPQRDIPRFVELFRGGQLQLEPLVTRTYSLDELNEGYRDMHAGANIRGVVLMH